MKVIPSPHQTLKRLHLWLATLPIAISHTQEVNSVVKTFLSNPSPPPEEPIEYIETATIIKNLKNGKSPGVDGM